jgi:hypothetical protein
VRIMKRLLWPLALVLVPAVLGLTGLLLAHTGGPAAAPPPDTTAASSGAASPTPAPTASDTATGTPRPAGTHRPAPHGAGPWAVVRAYYRDVGAREYAQAWALASPALAAVQSYSQFVAGYACTGTEQPTRLGGSGNQVSFNLTVRNRCTGAAQYFTGTDTVRGGKIVAADVTRTG